MKINGHGQAKILTKEEKNLLFTKGFLCQRDRTLFEICYYTACRIGEARQIQWGDVFNGDLVKDMIVIRKCITKAKQATRIVPTHPKLAESLQKYVDQSRELLDLKKRIGTWNYKSFECGQVFDENQNIICPKCANNEISTAGYSRGKRVYKCQNCQYRFLVNTAFVEQPELRERIQDLGVYSSTSYGFLFLNPQNPYLFPGMEGKGHISSEVPKRVLSQACKRVGIVGASTHSWRRTALTEMHKGGVPLRVIQSISGHVRLANLQKYLEVSREEVQKAISLLP